MEKIIIIEKINFLSRFLINFFNKRKNKFYIFNSYQIDSNEVLYKPDNLKVIRICHSLEQDITYKANQIALDYLEKLHTDEILKFINYFGYKNELIYAFKKYYLWKITKKIRLSLICDHIKDNYKNIKIELLTENNFFLKKLYKRTNTKNFKFNNKKSLYRLIKIIAVIFFYLPFWVFKDLSVNGFSFKKVKVKEFKIGQHICNNFYKRDNYEHRDFGKSRNDIFINRQLNFNLNGSAFVKSSWKFSKEDMQKNMQTINYNNGELIEELNLKNNISIIKLFFFKYLKTLNLIQYLAVLNYDELKIYSIIQIIRDIFIIEKFCSYYRICKFYSRDDFNPLHIVRTVVFNNYSLENHGVSHSIFLEPNTTLRGPYTFFDVYHTQGNIYHEMFQNTWKSREHINSGPIYSVLVSEAMKNHERRILFNKKYKQKIKYLLLISNYDSNSNPFDSWKINSDRIRNLSKILDVNDDSALFIVPRNKNSIKNYLNQIDINNRFQKKIILDNSFSTYELLAYCNILISEASSSSLFEATINPDIAIMPFNVRGINNLAFNRNKNIKVFHTSEEIYEYLSNMQKNNVDLSNLKLNNYYIKILLSNNS